MLNKSMYARIKNCQRGAVIVLFALLLPVLFGFMGLGIDVGLAYVEKGKVQDIADSAALAGAAHLADEGDRLDAIQAEVKKYVEANGITLGVNGMLLKANDESWDEKETLAVGQDALVAYGVVSVTNSEGEAVDRVRVRVTKRIPSFFVNVIGDFSDGFVIVAKAAAEGEGEEIPIVPIVSSGLPGISANEGSISFYSTKIWSNKGRGLYNDLYCEGGFDFIDKDKLMLHGDYYAWNTNDNIHLKEGMFKNIAADQHDWEEEELRKDVAATKSLVKSEYAKYSTMISTMNIDSFKNGEDNKRYIDVNTKTITPPVKNGEFVDLYVDGSLMNSRPGIQPNGWNNVLTNDYLHGIKNIRNLYLKNVTALDVSNLTVGNVISMNDGLSIAGSNNRFTGTLFATANVYIGGYSNWFSSVLSKNIYIGYASNPDSPNCEWTTYPNSWKCYFYRKDQNPNDGRDPEGPDAPGDPDTPGEGGSGEGGSGEGSGSGSSGSSTMGKLRLVE